MRTIPSGKTDFIQVVNAACLACGRPVTLCGSCADRDQVARGDPALSGWESEPFRAFTSPELRSWLSARDCEIPVFTRVNGTLMARRLSQTPGAAVAVITTLWKSCA